MRGSSSTRTTMLNHQLDLAPFVAVGSLFPLVYFSQLLDQHPFHMQVYLLLVNLTVETYMVMRLESELEGVVGRLDLLAGEP